MKPESYCTICGCPVKSTEEGMTGISGCGLELRTCIRCHTLFFIGMATGTYFLVHDMPKGAAIDLAVMDMLKRGVIESSDIRVKE